ncbi:helix-turn-helix transcriptional regulator [Erwinia rhapontici]|uniref:helix-turn-helix domain-containing protein n=1 Tax=Erwinia rhapontici TaxID=55212 RepID=UPI003D35C64B
MNTPLLIAECELRISQLKIAIARNTVPSDALETTMALHQIALTSLKQKQPPSPMEPGRFSFSLAVQSLSLTHDIPLNEVARRIGIPVRSIHGVMSHNKPSVSTCEKYAEALGVSIMEFFSAGHYTTLQACA